MPMQSRSTSRARPRTIRRTSSCGCAHLPDRTLVDRLKGLFVPVTTPFDSVTGDVAPVAFRENLRKWVDKPIDGMLLFGSTGEGAILDEDEKQRLTGFARGVVPAGL